MCFAAAALLPALGGAAGATGGITGALGTLGTIGTVASATGGLLSAYSQMQNGRAQAAAASATAEQQNIAAQQAIEAGQRESDLSRRQFAREEGGNRVALAAAGIDVGSAAAIELLDSNRAEFEEDAFQIRENATRSANAYGRQAANSVAEARTARSNSLWQPLGTVLSTAASVSDRWSRYQQGRRPQTGYGAP